MRNGRVHKQITIWLVLAVLVSGLVQPAYAAEADKQTVRVAYFNMGNYYTEVSPGAVNSYDTEALAKISNYSNLKFEYVDCGTWANALEMLDRHEVDLVGTMQWTYEREKNYEFCLEDYGYTVGELAALPDRNYIYEDYEAIGRSVIGCTKNYVRMGEMKRVFEDHHISPEIKTYDGQKDLEDALESGEIDLIAANSHTMKNGWTVVEKFSYAPFYLVSWKGNEQLTDQLDAAIIAINMREPAFDDDLLQKYFPSIIGAPLTKAELSLIAENKTYTIYYDTATKPLVWYDEASESMKGVLVKVCGQISDLTGLKIQVLPIDQAPAIADETTIRYTTLFNGTSEDLSGNPGVTNALITESFNMYYRLDHKIDLEEDDYSVVIVKNRNLLKQYIQKNYPNSTVRECDSPRECVRELEAGRADMAYLDNHVAENAIIEMGITDIREFPIEASDQGIGMQFSGKDSALLASIVNKGIQQLDQNEISNSFVQYALETQEPVTWKTMLRDHAAGFAVISAVICLTLIGIAVLFTYARVMKKQKDKIAKANADRTEFFSRMSHDMRTPMNGILGMIRLSKESNSILEMHDDMNKAEAAGEYMLSLINDTLDLQRMESKKMKLELNVVSVRDYFETLFSMMRVSAEQKNLSFRVHYDGIDLDGFVELDPVRMKQILSNLISNAIKFTPQGGTVEVSIKSLGETESVFHRRYQVKDTGVGMSADFIENRLFKPYSQENNELSSQLTGSGLGMAITKNLVEIMGGHLEVESALGEGTVFTVYLDVKKASKEMVVQAEREKAEKEKAILADISDRRILLCEDHPLNAEIARRLLEKVGCQVEWAENGQLGVDRFLKSGNPPFDAILMDIRMPVMDGLAAARAIRASDRPDAASVPIIAMTANAYDTDIQNCMEAGMNAHVAKPVDPQQLYSVIYECIAANNKGK